MHQSLVRDRGAVDRQDVPRAVGARIRRARRHANLTIEALADRAGLASAYLSKVERGVQTPSVTVLFQIAEALGIELPSLMDLSEEEPLEELRGRALARIRKLDERQLRQLHRWLDALDF